MIKLSNELFRMNRLTQHENFHLANSAFYLYIYYKSIYTLETASSATYNTCMSSCLVIVHIR